MANFIKEHFGTTVVLTIMLYASFLSSSHSIYSQISPLGGYLFLIFMVGAYSKGDFFEGVYKII